jgi:hypothetical protein
MFKKSITIIAVLIFVFSCSKKDIDPITGKERLPQMSADERAKQFAEKGGGIFGSAKNRGTNYDFATSNNMWKATLKTLNFFPLQSIDYAGGVIITDWYNSENSNLNESIKININFFTDKISINSFQVNSYKKICDDANLKCNIIKLKKDFNDKIKNKIMDEVRILTLAEEKEKK